MLAPLVNIEEQSNVTKMKKFIPPSIVSKINKRKRLLKLDRQRLNNAHYSEIKLLSHGISVVGLFFNIYLNINVKGPNKHTLNIKKLLLKP